MRFGSDGYQIQIKVVADFLMNSGAHMNILFIIKVKIFMLIKMVIYIPPPQLWRLMSLEMVIIF